MVAQDLALICRMLHKHGLVSGRDGNVSVRSGADTLVATPSGVNKGFITEEMLITVDFNGKLLHGSGKVTSELSMHTLIYRMRADISAVIHTHAPYATAFAACGKTIPDNVLIEIPVIIGRIGLAGFAVPGTEAVAKSIEPFVKDCTVILLQNHGIVTFGRDIYEAYDRLEAVENAAKTILMAKLAGDARLIDPQTVRSMYPERTVK